MNHKGWVAVAAVALMALLFGTAARARDNARLIEKMKDTEQRIWVIDGTPVHNVGNLQMHVCNWGCFGSYPSSRYPYAESPSAQWPANSGVEYLYIAGLWVGAKKNGIPVVSTAAYEREFQPDPIDPLVKMYRSFEGAPNGARYPAFADDDKDAKDNTDVKKIDEDWLNGYDDDRPRDGRVDEDFAGISKQMFCCWFTDDQPTAVLANPEHTPLHLMVRQESYQWEEEKFYNFVGVQYWITNCGIECGGPRSGESGRGGESLEDVYIGFFADGDAGPRTREQYWQDDCVGLFEGIVCAERGDRAVPIRISVAYIYDDDGDDNRDTGKTLGYFGIMLLGHATDPLGEAAPKEVGFTSYQNFSGDQPYENGGDPSNDYQRYELMSKKGKDRNQEIKRDYRMMMAVGPFKELPPDSTMILQVAFVVGRGLDGMKKTAGNAALTYQGSWFDVDGNPTTGVLGRESPVYGPKLKVVLDSCVSVTETGDAAKGEIVWINADCRKEDELWNDVSCPKGNSVKEDYQTGVYGKEFNVHWLVGSAPPPPVMRLVPGDHKVMVFWNNYSEVTPDASTQQKDFEGYRIWRADGWQRPLGTSVLTGPSRELWQLIEERDLVNGVPPDIAFQKPDSAGGWQYEPLSNLPDRKKLIAYFEQSVNYYPRDKKVPCPPGLSQDECDTLEALARWNKGFEGGFQYYQYVDNSVHDGMHYFYAVTAYDHAIKNNVPSKVGYYGDPSSNFQYITPLSDAQEAPPAFNEKKVYVVPNPATKATMAPWSLEPNQTDPTGIKVEFRNLPRCRSTIRIYTVSGDLVEVMYHDGSSGHGTLTWDLVSRNNQDVTSGVYLFAVEPEDSRFPRVMGKFVVIR
jgi:hypothetical protein